MAAKGDIEAELDEVRRMADGAADVGSATMSKLTRDSYHQQNRKRGRAIRPEDRS